MEEPVMTEEGFTLTCGYKLKTKKDIALYEPHGFFKFRDMWVLYGHEEIVIITDDGNELIRHHTR